MHPSFYLWYLAPIRLLGLPLDSKSCCVTIAKEKFNSRLSWLSPDIVASTVQVTRQILSPSRGGKYRQT